MKKEFLRIFTLAFDPKMIPFGKGTYIKKWSTDDEVVDLLKGWGMVMTHFPPCMNKALLEQVREERTLVYRWLESHGYPDHKTSEIPPVVISTGVYNAHIITPAFSTAPDSVSPVAVSKWVIHTLEFDLAYAVEHPHME